MHSGEPSRTAEAAAFHRAAHQVLEEGRIFADPLALRILGADAETVAREAEAHPSRRTMRIFIAVRHRFAEDALTRAIERGVRQVVVLGAGLDTWSYRTSMSDRVRIFEVDHPATQAWKRERLAAASIPAPPSLTYTPVDFQRSTLADGLAAAGFDVSLPTFFTWLGVVPYLPADAVWRTLGFIANLPNGAHVVFDYANPPESFDPEVRAAHQKRAARVAAMGEPWLTYFDAEELRVRLSAIGFSEIEDLGPGEIVSRYFPVVTVPVRGGGGHVLYAGTAGSISGEMSAGTRSP